MSMDVHMMLSHDLSVLIRDDEMPNTMTTTKRFVLCPHTSNNENISIRTIGYNNP